jgi:hypothetical protein
MRPTTLRLGALLSAGALAVHELRYRIAFGDAAGATADAYGHGYLAFVSALIAFALAFALAAFVLQVAAPGRDDGREERRERVLLLAAVLLVMYTSQELLEGWLASGHPPGLDGAFGQGGWVAVPLALAVGALVCVCLRGARAVVARRSRDVTAPRLPVPVPARIGPDLRRRPWRDRRLVARFLVGRAPPVGLSR